MAEKHLIDADALIQYLTDWKNDLDGKPIGWEDVPEQAVQMHIDDLIGGKA